MNGAEWRSLLRFRAAEEALAYASDLFGRRFRKHVAADQ